MTAAARLVLRAAGIAAGAIAWAALTVLAAILWAAAGVADR